MWFHTTQKDNPRSNKKILFIPVKVLQIWDCKTCLNIIFMKKSTFSTFNEQTDPSPSNWSLENINVELVQCQDPRYVQIGLKGKRLQQVNDAKIYCRVCTKTLLGEFKPQIDLKRAKFKYSFVPCLQNLNKAKIIMGKTNRNQIRQSESRILNSRESIDTYNQLTRLRMIYEEINQFIAFLLYSKNFKIYQPFANQSRKMRDDLEIVKKFVMKTKPNKQRKESLVHKSRQLSLNSYSNVEFHM